MGTRALVIGLDGAEWSVIRRLQTDGLLPNITVSFVMVHMDH